MRRTTLLLALAAASGSAAADDTAEPLANRRRVAAGIDVGGEPAGDAGFAALRALGVRTVVSVDGFPPDASRAAAGGMRVIHIPLGYDGVHAAAREQLAAVAARAPRPIYVHCHHGRHRGPAAAAIVALAAGLIDHDGAAAFLRRAGADPAYEGLWRDVADFDPAANPRPSADLPEQAAVDPFVLAMAQLGRAWKNDDPLGVDESLREAARAAPRRDPSGGLSRSLDELRSIAARPASKPLVAARCVACHGDHGGGPLAVADGGPTN